MKKLIATYLAATAALVAALAANEANLDDASAPEGGEGGGEEVKRGRGRPRKDETTQPPATETKTTTEQPAGKTYDDMRKIIQPLVDGGRMAEVKAVIVKYAVDLKSMKASDYPAFERDIEALSL